jgi:hypothetical protein
MLKDMEAASARSYAKSNFLGEILSAADVRKWIAVALVIAAGLFSAGAWLGACLR